MVLGDMYVIKSKLDAGNYGQVYEVSDISNPNLSLVAKISKNDENFAKELKVLQNCFREKLISFGYIGVNYNNSFIILPKYRTSLWDFYKIRKT
jgi:serine/threonine protein kinase